jgi:hypothetical protein
MSRISGDVLPENTGMRHMADTLGFRLYAIPNERTLKAVLDM